MTPNSVRIKNALTVSNGVSISGNVVISNGQLVVGGTAINSTSVSEAANNAYTNATIFAANASNANNGTLAEARLPFRMDQAVRTTDSPTFANGSFTGSLSVGGTLTITGNLISQNVQSLAVADPLIKLGVNNASDVLWGGFTFHYNGSGNTTNHAGLVRSPTSKEFILMSTLGDEDGIFNNRASIAPRRQSGHGLLV